MSERFPSGQCTPPPRRERKTVGQVTFEHSGRHRSQNLKICHTKCKEVDQEHDDEGLEVLGSHVSHDPHPLVELQQFNEFDSRCEHDQSQH